MWCWDVVVLFLRRFRRQLLAVLGLGSKMKREEPLLPMQQTQRGAAAGVPSSNTSVCVGRTRWLERRTMLNEMIAKWAHTDNFHDPC